MDERKLVGDSAPSVESVIDVKASAKDAVKTYFRPVTWLFALASKGLKAFFRSKRLMIVTAVLLALFLSYRWVSTEYTGQPHLWTAPSGTVQWMAQDKYDGGKIVVRVGTTRSAGNRIGDVIAMRVEMVTDRDVQLDLSTVVGGTLAAVQPTGYYYYGGAPDNPPDFELVETPTVTSFDSKGKHVYQIDLLVRSWKVSDTIAFLFKFQWRDQSASSFMNEETTPAATLETTRSAQKDDQFDLGNTNMQPAHRSPAADPVQWIGFSILLGLIGWLIFTMPARIWPFRQRSPEERAWSTFNDVFQHASDKWTEAHYMAIATALRKYLAIALPGLDTQPVEELRKRQDIADKPAILAAFQMLDDAMYAQRALRAEERSELRAMLQTLVPQTPPITK
jgi:hypothetical protein